MSDDGLEPIVLPAVRELPEERQFPNNPSFRESLAGRVLASAVDVQRRFSPRRLRWQQVAEFDERVAERGQRSARTGEELTSLRERHRLAVQADQEALAAWQADDVRGPRPQRPTSSRSRLKLR
jgi:hypothetical protein